MPCTNRRGRNWSLIRVIRKPEVIDRFLDYVCKVGDADIVEFEAFVDWSRQISYWDDYRGFAINYYLVQQTFQNGRDCYVPTEFALSVVSGGSSPDLRYNLVPQYARYLLEISERLESGNRSIDRAKLNDTLSTSSSPFSPRGFEVKDHDFNMNRYRLWDQEVGVRSRGHQERYLSSELRSLLKNLESATIMISSAYVSGDIKAFPKNQHPAYALLLLLSVADCNGCKIRSGGVLEVFRRRFEGFSQDNMRDLLDYLDRMGFPLNTDHSHLSVSKPLLITAEFRYVEDIVRLLIERIPESREWYDLSREVYRDMYDTGIFGEVSQVQGCEWIFSDHYELRSLNSLQAIVDSQMTDLSNIEHDGDFHCDSGTRVTNIFSYSSFLIESLVWKIRQKVDGVVRAVARRTPSEILEIKACTGSSFVLGRLPLLEISVGNLRLTAMGRHLFSESEKSFRNDLVTMLYYTNPYVMLASEIMRSEFLRLERHKEEYSVHSDHKVVGLLNLIESVLRKRGFRILDGHYRDDKEKMQVIEQNLMSNMLDLGIAEKTGTQIGVSEVFKGFSQMIYSGQYLRRDLREAFKEEIAV